MLLAATAVFLYYTVWTFVLPFLSEDAPLQKLFLPREYAIQIPVFALIVGVVGIGLFIGNVMLKSTKKKGKTK